jgi:hypothetical protein
MVDKFTCRECGRTTYSDNYEWRDERLYLNLKKLRLCEECYRFGQDTTEELKTRKAPLRGSI